MYSDTVDYTAALEYPGALGYPEATNHPETADYKSAYNYSAVTVFFLYCSVIVAVNRTIYELFSRYLHIPFKLPHHKGYQQLEQELISIFREASESNNLIV